MTSSEPVSGRRRKATSEAPPSLGRPEDDLLSTAQVAQMLHVSPQTVSRLVKSGSLPAHRIPGTRQLLFWRHQIAELVNANRVHPDDVEAIDAGEESRPIKGGGR
jgi:excisionase family DNA binding protein